MLISLLGSFESMAILQKAIQALANFITDQAKIREKLFDQQIQDRLAEMYDKLSAEAELQSEIVFFMHNCLVSVKNLNSK